MRNRILTVCLLVALSMSSNQAFGATAKVGGTCTKVGAKTGSLICVKVSGKLKWQILKKAQAISFSAPVQVSITDSPVAFTYSSSSKLSVTASSLSLSICSLGKASIVLTGTPGNCQVLLKQAGNTYFLPAKQVTVEIKVTGTNLIDFQLPGALLLSQRTFPLTATSSSNLPVAFVSNTPNVCSISDSTLTLLQVGTCTVMVTQAGSDFIPVADPVTQSLEISASRVTADLPDTVFGFQIKPVYVVPSDGVDNFYDTNGYLASVLDEGNSYLKSQIGLTIPIDRTATGYDIQYLKSQYSTEYLRTHAQSTTENTSDSYLLLSEMKAMENPGANRKDYIFFIEVPGFDGSYCGMADTPGMKAVIALENVSDTGICRGKAAPFFENFTSKTWVHEFIHTLGVTHTLDDPCDLMAGKETPGTCTSSVKYTMDKERTRYVGASTQGQDITKMRVWQGYTDNQNMKADCIINPVARLDGIEYAYCPTGTRAIGELNTCWSEVSSASLEEQVAGNWVSLGSANYFSTFWGGDRPDQKCTDPNFPDAVWKELTVDTPGVLHYRWVVNGKVDEVMNVIWVN